MQGSLATQGGGGNSLSYKGLMGRAVSKGMFSGFLS